MLKHAIEAIHAALDGGINWIDTAAVYGLGHSEEVVARALEGRSNRPYVFTKCERTWNESREIKPSLKADSIRKECEASLRRLKVDAIDLYQIHWPQPEEDIEEGWGELARLKQEGKVRWIGVSNFNMQQMERIAKDRAHHVAAAAILGDLARNRDGDPALLPAAQHWRNCVSPMKSGLLTGKMTRERVKPFPPTISDARRWHFRSRTSRATSRCRI